MVPGCRGGRPAIRGSRITVDDILEALSVGWNIDEIEENYEIPREAILEAIRYALESLRKVETFFSYFSGKSGDEGYL
ncbi:MAG: antitoxin [Thermoprotei archaeon]|nr:MAG: antitoxin [Thermoprotei archaeon]